MKNINWIDFKALERNDVDEKFGLFDFLFYGSRWTHKRSWWVIIPLLNAYLVIACMFAWITIPLRWYINSSQLRKLRKNAYDIEDTYSTFRLIRNVNGYLGLCEWGLSFEFSRKVLLESQYVRIIRWQENAFIVTNKNNKMGLYRTGDNKWVLPCEYEQINIISSDIVLAKVNGRSQHYNIFGDRIMSR